MLRPMPAARSPEITPSETWKERERELKGLAASVCNCHEGDQPHEDSTDRICDLEAPEFEANLDAHKPDDYSHGRLQVRQVLNRIR